MMPLLAVVFRWFLRAIAVFLVVSFPTLAIYDHVRPWQPAIKALSAYSGQSRVCVGFGTDSEWSPTASHSSVQRSFILVPRALTSPSIITVTATDGALVAVSESSAAFWFLLAIHFLALVFCIRLIRVFFSTRHAESAGNV